MFKVSYTALSDSGVLNPLVRDYLNADEKLKPFYNYFPDLNGFKQAIAGQPYHHLNRDLLVRVLLSQSEQVSNFGEEGRKNLELLQRKNTFTITTGHQLCLFTGPLYFIYKILSCIQICKVLKGNFPDSDFIPVYWMASEDHDFEEVNHFHLFGKTFKWETDQKGAVGEFNTKGLDQVHMMLRETLGESRESHDLIKLFEEAYLQHTTLALATRYLVNALFGKYGLLVIDGNDKRLKQEFREILSDDLFKNSSFTKVEESDKALKALGYELQVNPRPINCFYLEKGLRARIESSTTSFKVIGTELQFNTGQLSELVKEHPEKFSPNVVLRPLYQQKLLPNLAYVGGPGELAYWLQFKSMFEHYGEFYPVLVPRSFVSVFDKSTLDKLRKLNFSAEDLFLPEQELVRKLIARSEIKVDLETEKEKLKFLYNEIQNKTLLIDKSLDTAVVAELQKALNGVQNLESKILKALKSRSETEINQVKSSKQKLFPGNVPQERHDNFAGYYLKYGAKFIEELEENLNPLLLKQIVLCEEA